MNLPGTDLHTTHSSEECWITLDGARMRYLLRGSGPALLLLHGLLGYSFSWRFAMPVFSRQHTVYAVDMLGSGYSDKPLGIDHSLKASAGRLIRFLDEVAVESCDLLGTSHGGAVAMMAAALAPHRVRRLILAAPVNPWSSHGKRLGLVLTNRLVSRLLLRLAPYLRVAHSHVLRRLYGDARRIQPGTLEGYSAPFKVPGSIEHGLAVMHSWNQDLEELESVLPQIANIPTLLLWGTKDLAVDPASAIQLRRNFKDCRLVMFEGVGHLPYEEVPDEFNRAVGEFLGRSQGDDITN